MQEYESIFVLTPEVSEADVDQEIEKIRELITSGDGEVTEVQKWGRRKLAYEINKKKEGVYTLIRFKGGSEQPKELNRRYRLNESLLRHLTVVYEEPVMPEGGYPEGEGERGEESREERGSAIDAPAPAAAGAQADASAEGELAVEAEAPTADAPAVETASEAVGTAESEADPEAKQE